MVNMFGCYVIMIYLYESLHLKWVWLLLIWLAVHACVFLCVRINSMEVSFNFAFALQEKENCVRRPGFGVCVAFACASYLQAFVHNSFFCVPGRMNCASGLFHCCTNKLTNSTSNHKILSDFAHFCGNKAARHKAATICLTFSPAIISRPTCRRTALSLPP